MFAKLKQIRQILTLVGLVMFVGGAASGIGVLMGVGLLILAYCIIAKILF